MAEATIAQGMWCHIEIPSSDTAKAKSFYGDVFGWTFQEVPIEESTYHLYFTGEGGIGGGIWDPPEGMPRQTINYINVEKIEPIVAAAEKKGGTVLVPKQEIPGIGWFSILTDPDGNLFGVWKQNPEAH